jgi:hypothetical protein
LTDAGDPLQVAAAKAMRAHHVLAVMQACTTPAELTDAAADFLAAARSAAQTLARVGESVDDDAFAQWVGERLLALRAHPIEAELSAATRPAITTGRIARGSEHPPFRHGDKLVLPTHDDEAFFCFEGLDRRPAVDLCAEYLQYLTLLVDESRARLSRVTSR